MTDLSGWTFPYRPETPQQTTFHQCPAQDVLFHGPARLTTASLYAAAVVHAQVLPGARLLLLRSTYRQLEQDTIPHLTARIPDHIARYSDHTFRFVNDATLELGWITTDEDLFRCTDIDATMILWHGLPEFTRAQYTTMRSRLKVTAATKPALQARDWTPGMLATTTTKPAGWTRRMYVDPALAGSTFTGGIEDGEDPSGRRTMAYICY